MLIFAKSPGPASAGLVPEPFKSYVKPPVTKSATEHDDCPRSQADTKGGTISSATIPRACAGAAHAKAASNPIAAPAIRKFFTRHARPVIIAQPLFTAA